MLYEVITKGLGKVHVRVVDSEDLMDIDDTKRCFTCNDDIAMIPRDHL